MTLFPFLFLLTAEHAETAEIIDYKTLKFFRILCVILLYVIVFMKLCIKNTRSLLLTGFLHAVRNLLPCSNQRGSRFAPALTEDGFLKDYQRLLSSYWRAGL
jgi:hypothetical protein